MNLVRHYGLTTTEGFGDWHGEDLARWSRFSTFEIMVHPNYDATGDIINVVDFERNSGPKMMHLSAIGKTMEITI